MHISRVHACVFLVTRMIHRRGFSTLVLFIFIVSAKMLAIYKIVHAWIAQTSVLSLAPLNWTQCMYYKLLQASNSEEVAISEMHILKATQMV